MNKKNSLLVVAIAIFLLAIVMIFINPFISFILFIVVAILGIWLNHLELKIKHEVNKNKEIEDPQKLDIKIELENRRIELNKLLSNSDWLSCTIKGTGKYNRQKWISKLVDYHSLIIKYSDSFKTFMVYACLYDFDIEDVEKIDDNTTDDICIGFLNDVDANEVIEECIKRNISYDIFEHANILDVVKDEKTGLKVCQIHFALLD